MNRTAEDKEALSGAGRLSETRAAAGQHQKNRDLLTDHEAAAYIGMSVSWLRNGRSQQRSNQPRYLKISNRVRYRRSDLDAWLAEQVVEPGDAA